MNTKRALGAALLTAGAVSAAYPLLLRKRCLTWGATPDEITADIPGDDLMPQLQPVALRERRLAQRLGGAGQQDLDAEVQRGEGVAHSISRRS